MLGALVAEHGGAGGAGGVPGVVAQGAQEQAELIGGAGVVLDLLDGAGILDGHGDGAVGELVRLVGGVGADPVLAEVAQVAQLLELVQDLQHLLVAGEGGGVVVQRVVQAGGRLFIDAADLEEGQLMPPAVRACHEPGGDALLGDLRADVLQLRVGGGHGQAQLVEQGLVVQHHVLGAVVPDLQAVQLAAGDAGALAGFGHHVLPIRAGEVDAAVLGVADHGFDGAHGVGLDPEHVGAGAVGQAAGQHVEVLVGGQGLQVHGHAIGLLEAGDGRVIAVSHPVGGYQNAQLLALELPFIGHGFDHHVLGACHREHADGQHQAKDNAQHFLHVSVPPVVICGCKSSTFAPLQSAFYQITAILEMYYFTLFVYFFLKCLFGKRQV